MRLSASLLPLILILACNSSPTPPTLGISAQSFANSEWSEPVHLDAPINSPFRELGAALSPDELSIYFGSNRPDPTAQGAFDIWVSHRACRECPWEDPVNLGPNINSTGATAHPCFPMTATSSSSRARGLAGRVARTSGCPVAPIPTTTSVGDRQ